MEYISCVVIAYLMGSIPTAVWIGRIFYNKDIREEGSGNAGATNTIRVLGLKAGIPVLLFDVFKGWITLFLLQYWFDGAMNTEELGLVLVIAAFAVVIGHVFPLFAGFRGGKGIATLLGVGIALYPSIILYVVLIFIAVFLLSGYVSLGSITAAVSLPLLYILIVSPMIIALLVLSVIVGIFVPLTHRKNIHRLINGSENKILYNKENKYKKRK
jgi:glycerol-3-phosphate acyltransferase PlsY